MISAEITVKTNRKTVTAMAEAIPKDLPTFHAISA